MIVERSEDYEAIGAVLTHPDIWETISGDNEHPESFEVPKGENVYLLGYNNKQVIGLICLHPHDKDEWVVHIQVLPEHRKEIASEFANTALNWIWTNTDINKLRALIPEIYPNVKRFSESIGFKDEAFITNSYTKGGQLYSKWLLTIKRGE